MDANMKSNQSQERKWVSRMKFLSNKVAKRVANKVVIDKLFQENVQLKLNIDKAIETLENAKEIGSDDFNRGLEKAIMVLNGILGE